MVVRKLRLDGFRNYTDFTACFSDRVNIIIGNNAQGKTNLIEAIWFLTQGRSFRARNDREMIGFERNDAVIYADVTTQGRDQTMEARLLRASRRQFFVNSVKLKTAAELSGKLRAVLFCPDDLNLVRDGAAVRRRLMDACLCQLRPRYAAILAEFNRLLEHKTRILKDYKIKPSLLDTLDDFDARLAALGAELIHYRSAFSSRLSEKASAIHFDFSGGVEKLTITYRTVKTITDVTKKPEQLLNQLLAHQQEHRRAELESGTCLSGAHKDDLEIHINGQAARCYASQGQARTAALSIKLAERDIHFHDSGEHPILLLDDVLSELDRSRQQYVLNHIHDGQVFITCCEDARIGLETGGRLLHIAGGELTGS
ncbi:DNA replication/repair protein RecF [Oscillospiraceae bacterium CM]|nr:DNA replication/repair protein RecF [Oscillospiraceae bacterium CM]